MNIAGNTPGPNGGAVENLVIGVGPAGFIFDPDTGWRMRSVHIGPLHRETVAGRMGSTPR